MSGEKCISCRRPTPNPAHVEETRRGVCRGSTLYRTVRTAWCADCWAENVRWCEEYRRKADAQTARMVAEALQRMGGGV